MTRSSANSAADIAHATEILAELELQFAKARFANDYDCVRRSFLPATIRLD